MLFAFDIILRNKIEWQSCIFKSYMISLLPKNLLFRTYLYNLCSTMLIIDIFYLSVMIPGWVVSFPYHSFHFDSVNIQHEYIRGLYARFFFNQCLNLFWQIVLFVSSSTEIWRKKIVLFSCTTSRMIIKVFFTGIQGFWMAHLEEPGFRFQNHAVLCLVWYYIVHEEQANPWLQNECPCDLTSLRWDPWFFEISTETSDTVCYDSWTWWLTYPNTIVSCANKVDHCTDLIVRTVFCHVSI